MPTRTNIDSGTMDASIAVLKQSAAPLTVAEIAGSLGKKNNSKFNAWLARKLSSLTQDYGVYEWPTHDLLMGSKKAEREEIEGGFFRIAQIGRAAGVHLILATQRPSRQVVSGLLKANIPARIALQVANRVESGVLLDQGGAQYLLGKGDLLISAGRS
jgi:hypothetical protein